jgi:hypothetical protein
VPGPLLRPTSARSQRALLCRPSRPSRRRAGCLSLSSAHLTLVNRFHDAHNRIPQQTQTAPNTIAIRNPQSAIYPPSLAPSRLTPAAPEFESHQRHRDCPSTTSATATQHERQIPEDVCALNPSTTLLLSGLRALRHPRTHHPLLFFQHRAGTP